MHNNLRFLAKWSRDISCDLLILKNVKDDDFFSVLNFVSAPSCMPKLEPIIHFPQVNPLVPGLKLLEGVCFAQKLVTFSEGSVQKHLSPKHLIKFYREKEGILETVRLQSCSKVRFIWWEEAITSAEGASC